MILCQSCGMPLESSEMKETSRDSSLSNDYCTFCYQNGEFTQNLTMDEMIDHCSKFVDEFNKNSNKKITKEEAIFNMKQLFPTLKRWVI